MWKNNTTLVSKNMVKINLVTVFLVLISTIFSIQLTYSQEDIDSDESQNIPQSSPTVKPKVDVTIEGTANDDKIRGGTGDDKIKGEEGYDTLEGSDGTDKIDGGEGDDKIKGGRGDDKIKGDEGNDRIEGNQGDDNLDGGDGNDSVKGGKENDQINGGEGNDKLEGGEGIDEMEGGKGSDNFICDMFDKILDFDSQEGDSISGECKFDDKSAINSNSDNPSSVSP